VICPYVPSFGPLSQILGLLHAVLPHTFSLSKRTVNIDVENEEVVSLTGYIVSPRIHSSGKVHDRSWQWRVYSRIIIVWSLKFLNTYIWRFF
jgi:hypothetical protein